MAVDYSRPTAPRQGQTSSPGCSGESLPLWISSTATDCTCDRQCHCMAHKRLEKPCPCCRPSCRPSCRPLHNRQAEACAGIDSKSPLELAFSRQRSHKIEDGSQGTPSPLCTMGLTKLVFPEPLTSPLEQEEVQETKLCHHDIVVLDRDLVLVDGDVVEINHVLLETEWPPCWGCNAEAHDYWLDDDPYTYRSESQPRYMIEHGLVVTIRRACRRGDTDPDDHRRYRLNEHPHNCRFEPRPRYMLAVWSLLSGALRWRPTDLCCGGNLRSSFFLAHGRWTCGGRTIRGYENIDRWLSWMVARIGRALWRCWARCWAAAGYPHELD